MPNVSKVRQLARQTLEMMQTDLTDEEKEYCIDYAWTLNDLGMSEREAVIAACKEFVLKERSF